jgi:hypothetical protein
MWSYHTQDIFVNRLRFNIDIVTLSKMSSRRQLRQNTVGLVETREDRVQPRAGLPNLRRRIRQVVEELLAVGLVILRERLG